MLKAPVFTEQELFIIDIIYASSPRELYRFEYLVQGQIPVYS